MKKLLILTLAVLSPHLLAETFVSRVHTANAHEGFLRLENGRVAFLKRSQTLPPAGAKVIVELNTENELTSLAILDSVEEKSRMESLLLEPERPTFEPTVLPDMKAATAMFERLRPDFKRVSECSDRAHVWAYDEFKAHGIKSRKVFAFFTASYINRNRFKWWFHVAPLVDVKMGSKVEPMVMDYLFTDGPRTIKQWTDLMVFSRRTCRMTQKFSEYDVNPQTEDCYMMIDSMYYRLPGDLHLQETEGKFRDGFNESEVSFSRNLAFEKTSISTAEVTND